MFGIKGSVKNNISFADENIVVYPCGHNVVIHNMESKEQQFIHGMETGSTGGITALAVSANKRCGVCVVSFFLCSADARNACLLVLICPFVSLCV